MGDKILIFAVMLATIFTTAAPSRAQNVVTDWTAIASNSIVTKGAKPSATSSVWFAYASIAVYDAVNAVHQEFQPFYFRGIAPPGASEEAAAIAAAHRVLVNYFPFQQAALDAQFNNALDKITAPSNAKSAGVALGEEAASALIAARAGDGLEANVSYTPGRGPGKSIRYGNEYPMDPKAMGGDASAPRFGFLCKLRVRRG